MEQLFAWIPLQTANAPRRVIADNKQ